MKPTTKRCLISKLEHAAIEMDDNFPSSLSLERGSAFTGMKRRKKCAPSEYFL